MRVGRLSYEEIKTIVVAFSFTAFLLTFPNFGPVAIEIVKEKGLNGLEFFTQYLLSHMFGIGVAGLTLDRVRRRIALSKIIAIMLIVFSVASYFYPFSICLVGFFLGFTVVIMGSLLSRCVRPWMRGKILAAGAAMANVYLIAVGHSTWTSFKLLFLGIFPLLFFFLLSEIEFDFVEERRINIEFVKFALPVMVFYVLSGIMYGKMEPVFLEEGIKTHVLFYAVAILVAGHIYDAFGRRPVSIFGIFLIAIAFASFPISHLASAYLIQSSYAFIDIFAMLVWADLSYYGSEAKQYGLGVFFIVFAIFVGFVVSQTVSIGYLLIEVILIMLLFSSILIVSAKEPMKSPEEYMEWARKFAR